MRRKIKHRLRGWKLRAQDKEIVHVLHIGKTGGNAIKEALRQAAPDPHWVFQLHNYKVGLKARLELPERIALPSDDVKAHRNPKAFSIELTEQAQANLERWYSRDYEFLEMCREWRSELDADFGDRDVDWCRSMAQAPGGEGQS